MPSGKALLCSTVMYADPNSHEIGAAVSDLPYKWAWYTNRLVRFRLGEAAQRDS